MANREESYGFWPGGIIPKFRRNRRFHGNYDYKRRKRDFFRSGTDRHSAKAFSRIFRAKKSGKPAGWLSDLFG